MDINAIPINHGISSEHWIEFIREHGLCIYDSTSGDKPEFTEPSEIEVNVYDFIGELGKAAPYGVYDITLNNGWVNVGISHDTAEFSVNSIRNWWLHMGQKEYPNAKVNLK